MNSDLLDEYCEMEFGHTDWAMSWDADGNLIVTFHKEMTKEYWSDFIVEKDMRPVKMRKDLAEEGITIPAGRKWSNYDDLEDVIHLSAEDLEGAYEYDTGEDPDSHAFCPVKLRDGQVVYMIGVDLEWFDEEYINA
jgi:hypothetical protein